MSDILSDVYHDFVVAQAGSIRREIMELHFKYRRQQIAARSIQSRFGVHSSTAEWLAGRLPEDALPSRVAVETLIALEIA